jgi:putative ABC transport system ATP-binding protein
VETREVEPAEAPAIEMYGVRRVFEVGEYGILAVDGVDLQVQNKEYVAVVGASGAGKTTLLNLMAGLDRQTAGTIRLTGITISDMGEEALSTLRVFTIGFVFQDYNLISSLTALENIEFPMTLAGVAPEVAAERAALLLEEVGLSERADHLPHQLSAGERQRVAIARALANDPPIIVADEPTANLDHENAQYIGEFFENLRGREKTIVCATHDERLIGLAHRVITFDAGAIIEYQRR